MKALEEVKQKFLKMIENGSLETSGWIEWIHEGNKAAETNAEKQANVDSMISSASAHCAKCTNLGGCRFLRAKMPPQPLHYNCHCRVKSIEQPIPNITAFAECPIEKITGWAFINPAKKRFFESNGYDIIDANDMQIDYEQQAVEKYTQGYYKLGLLDDYGQRITILIELQRHNTQPLKFETGWMVYPYGKIRNTTPATNLGVK